MIILNQASKQAVRGTGSPDPDKRLGLPQARQHLNN